MELRKINDYLWEIPPSGEMKVPGRIYASLKLLEKIREDDSLKQVSNVATLPGIIGYSFAMPDIHAGYGFSIGGVAAMDVEEGVVSPGGVGYDINCGIRLAKTNLKYEEIKDKIDKIVSKMFSKIPSGVGSHGAIPKLSKENLKKVLIEGSKWAVENGFGKLEDIELTEEKGSFDGADADVLSKRAIERGLDQLGTVGSGNHFVELSVVEEIFLPEIAKEFGIFEGQVVIFIHSGSRGLGYQVCDDYLRILGGATQKYGIKLPDRQLACVPINSPEGKQYISAMKASANFAWANRQILMALTERAIQEALGISPKPLGFQLIYDLAHNIAKFEEHIFNGKKVNVLVHRKGATRAFGPGRKEIPEKYRKIGQPVLLPGDMGRASYLLIGTEKAMEETFGSSAHGAGRIKSRSQAIREGSSRNIAWELKEKNVFVMAEGKKTLLEEMPDAYKDVNEIALVTEKSGISLRVCRMKPIGVIKG